MDKKRPSVPPEEWLPQLAGRLLAGHSSLIEAARERLDETSAADLAKDEDEIKKLYSRLLDPPPNPQPAPEINDLDDFVDALEKREWALRSFEDDLHKLSEDPDYLTLVGSFEEMLKDPGSLLLLLELFLGVLPFPSNPRLVAELEDLLEGFQCLLRSFERLLQSIPRPHRRFIFSFADLLAGASELCMDLGLSWDGSLTHRTFRSTASRGYFTRTRRFSVISKTF
jgi:hypothetical protein